MWFIVSGIDSSSGADPLTVTPLSHQWAHLIWQVGISAHGAHRSVRPLPGPHSGAFLTSLPLLQVPALQVKHTAENSKLRSSHEDVVSVFLGLGDLTQSSLFQFHRFLCEFNSPLQLSRTHCACATISLLFVDR